MSRAMISYGTSSSNAYGQSSAPVRPITDADRRRLLDKAVATCRDCESKFGQVEQAVQRRVSRAN